ncbi:MAG: NHL repeat-containing protein, partial [Planctomycetes bacterium]|nr:NHL repeat-containing protein [Planctomycetota bacterium]
HAITGVLMHESPPGWLNAPTDLIITADRRILVASAGDNRIVEFDRTGAYVGDLVTSGLGGLSEPGAMAISPAGELLVVSTATNAVLRYDINSGAFLGPLVAPGAAPMTRPYGLTFGPGGNLYVSSDDNRVLKFDAATGAYQSDFVTLGNNGGLTAPRDILFMPDASRFLVASKGTDQVLEYHPITGAFIGQYNNGDYRGKLNGPWGLRVGPDGNVYVGASDRMESAPGAQLHLTDPRIILYEGSTGNLWYAYVQGRDSTLRGPRGFAFMPGEGFDCNRNQLPDSCDIASGFSQDQNNNGIPDECEFCYADCDQSTGFHVLDIFDFLCFQNSFVLGEPYACECDPDPACDILDFLCFQNAFVAGCP